MRLKEGPLLAGQTTAFFAGDLPTGGMSLECQNCMYVGDYSSEELHWDKPMECADCGYELLYPEGAEW